VRKEFVEERERYQRNFCKRTFLDNASMLLLRLMLENQTHKQSRLRTQYFFCHARQ